MTRAIAEKTEKTPLEDFVLDLTYVFAKRSTSGQKKRALLYIINQLKNAGIETRTYTRKVGVGNVHYCVAGDLKKAKRIILTPYDTPGKMYVPGYRYYPFNDEKNRKNELFNLVIMTVIRLVTALVIWLVTHRVDLSFLPHYTPNIYFIVFTAIAFYIENKKHCAYPNFNKSAASLAMVLNMAVANEGENAYVFLDRCSEGTMGLKTFLMAEKDTIINKKLFYIDCVASGGEIIAASVENKYLDTSDNPLGMKNVVFRKEDKVAIFDENYRLTVIMACENDNDEYSVVNIRSKKDVHISLKRLKELNDYLTTQWRD